MPHRHRALTAWLGLLAIWLTVAGPLASQWHMASEATPSAVICGAEHGPHTSSETDTAHHALHLDACGYCSFFAHYPALGTLSPAPIAPGSFDRQTIATFFDVVPAVKVYSPARARAPPQNA